MKLRSIITVLTVCFAALVLTSCERQPPAQPAGGENRPEAPTTNAAVPSRPEQPQPPVPEPSQPAPSMGNENQPPPAETNQPPNGAPVQ